MHALLPTFCSLKFLKVEKRALEKATFQLTGDLTVTGMTIDKHNADSYLLAVSNAIYRTQDFENFENVSGSPNVKSYRSGASPHFGEITGIITSTTFPDIIFVADKTHHCIRTLTPISQANTVIYLDAEVAGKCNNSDSIDGKANIARLFSPNDLIEESENKFLFPEKRKIRRLSYKSDGWYIDTIKEVDRDINRLAIRPNTEEIYLTFNSGMSFLGDEHIIQLIGTTGGHSDGPLVSASVYNPQHFLFLTNDIILLADRNNHVTRVVNLADFTISTLCSPPPHLKAESTSVRECRMDLPNFLLKVDQGKQVYIFDSTGLKYLSYEGMYFRK